MELKLKFTDKQNVTYILIFDESDLASGLVTLRNMITGEEKVVALNTIADAINAKKPSRCAEYIGGIH
ncbi:MAG: hypothetical protein A2Y23_08145 [Clostridiales bacterium GWB2_37_7]|nr:MAG: hypothetical protein A2Y23_08145 [Clostridiales bacterium GWB2_37_7]